MVKSLIEGNLQFDFGSDLLVVKLDETNFFNKKFKKLQGSKAVDFLVADEEKKIIYLIEVKDLRGHEREADSKGKLKLTGETSYAYNIPLKVRDSLACLVGGGKLKNPELIPFFELIQKENTQIKVILFLEGDIDKQDQTFKALTDKMKQNLKWLTSKVLVENKKKAKSSIYTIHYLPRST